MVRITHEPGDKYAWVCRCKNTPCGDGFNECDENGDDVEPVVGSGWNGLYRCNYCGAVIDQDTLEILGEVAYKVTATVEEGRIEGHIKSMERVFLSVDSRDFGSSARGT